MTRDEISVSTRAWSRAAPCYIAIGLPPGMVDRFLEELAEEGGRTVRVEHDDEGTASVVFRLAPWDRGTWLTSASHRYGCGLAPVRRG
jgi:hypothetical protein